MCELRTEKPWQGDEGPGFKSRQLHQEPQLDSVLAGAFLMKSIRAGVGLAGIDLSSQQGFSFANAARFYGRDDAL